MMPTDYVIPFANMDREEQRIQILSELDYLAYHGIIEIKTNY